MNPADSPELSGQPQSDRNDKNTPCSKLLLICHGEGMQHRYAGLGNMNSGLTAKGWAEVEALAQWLRSHEAVSALYSGPLLQSRLTAQRIGEAVQMSVATLRKPALEAVLSSTEAENNGQNGAGASSATTAAADAQDASDARLHELLVAESGATVALVVSPSTIRALLRKLLGANDTHIDLAHTSVTGLRRSERTWSVAYVNRREHLPVPALPPSQAIQPPSESDDDLEDMAPVVTVYDRVAREDIAEKASDDRERIEGLLDFADLPEGLNVLDAGAGLGVFDLMLAERGANSVIGVDISTGMLEQAEYLRLSQPTDTTNRVSYRLGSLQSLPFADERFDAVMCRLVLNHFHAPQRIVRELVRVLKPGGIFLMAELLSVDDPVKRATQNAIEERRNPAHVAARSAEQYDKMITDAGLEIVDTASVSIPRDLREWLNAYRTPDTVAATVIEMVEAGLETDAAGIGARRRGNRIEFVQRMYYLKAVKPVD